MVSGLEIIIGLKKIYFCTGVVLQTTEPFAIFCVCVCGVSLHKVGIFMCSVWWSPQHLFGDGFGGVLNGDVTLTRRWWVW